MQKLNIVFTIDKNYVQHFTVACTSLLENNLKFIDKIYLVHSISENDILEKEKLNVSLQYFKRKYSIVIKQLFLFNNILDKFKISHHITKATYFRLLLSEILPNNIDKVLYLDSDIIVNGALAGLLKLDFIKKNSAYLNYSALSESKNTDNEYYLMAVDHQHEISIPQLERLKKIGHSGLKYFNAGVMYINLKKWRDNHISNKLIENAIKYNDHIIWWDQDVLNITFDMKWGEIDYIYNAFNSQMNNNCRLKIVHYIGSSKPWHFDNNHPYKYLYWKYLKMTPFKRYIPADLTVLKLIKRIIPPKIKKMIKLVIHKK
jgi:lipopolysaccharide biosynthesis glycosyltransferase